MIQGAGKTALITGGHGFIGRHVASYLSKLGYVVSGMGHGSWGREEFSRMGFVFWHSTDITLDELMVYGNEPDVIVHCAGSGSVAFSMSHPYQDYVRTVSSAAAVLEYVRVYSPHTKVIYPSSAAVYGMADQLPIREIDNLRPASPYGVHKLMVESLCQSYASNFQVQVAIVRLFSIYGSGLQKQLLWDACSKLARNEGDFFGTGGELRDWLHVHDAANLICQLVVAASPVCPVFNGGSGAGLTTRDVLTTVFQEYGSTSTPKFTGMPRPGDPVGYQADVSKAVKMGWKPEISWQEGIAQYVQWFKETQL